MLDLPLAGGMADDRNVVGWIGDGCRRLFARKKPRISIWIKRVDAKNTVGAEMPQITWHAYAIACSNSSLPFGVD